MLHYFLSGFSSAPIKYKPVPDTCKAQAVFRTERGPSSQAVQNQQDLAFALLKAERGRGEAKERDSYKNIFPFPLKLNSLDVQMRRK